jgi:hypothetical protein
MLLQGGFLAAVLEGFEGALDEVVGRVASPELSADLVALQTRISALRVSIEPPEAEDNERFHTICYPCRPSRLWSLVDTVLYYTGSVNGYRVYLGPRQSQTQP